MFFYNKFELKISIQVFFQKFSSCLRPGTEYRDREQLREAKRNCKYNVKLITLFFRGNNQRIGEYSYVGDDGKTYTVRYEAGINGFRILSGDHIPSGGQTSASIR